jgi:hypothetical protein
VRLTPASRTAITRRRFRTAIGRSGEFCSAKTPTPDPATDREKTRKSDRFGHNFAPRCPGSFADKRSLTRASTHPKRSSVTCAGPHQRSSVLRMRGERIVDAADRAIGGRNERRDERASYAAVREQAALLGGVTHESLYGVVPGPPIAPSVPVGSRGPTLPSRPPRHEPWAPRRSQCLCRHCWCLWRPPEVRGRYPSGAQGPGALWRRLRAPAERLQQRPPLSEACITPDHPHFVPIALPPGAAQRRPRDAKDARAGALLPTTGDPMVARLTKRQGSGSVECFTPLSPSEISCTRQRFRRGDCGGEIRRPQTLTITSGNPAINCRLDRFGHSWRHRESRSRPVTWLLQKPRESQRNRYGASGPSRWSGPEPALLAPRGGAPRAPCGSRPSGDHPLGKSAMVRAARGSPRDQLKEYMRREGTRVSCGEFERGLAAKRRRPAFRRDMDGMLRLDFGRCDVDRAGRIVGERTVPSDACAPSFRHR